MNNPNKSRPKATAGKPSSKEKAEPKQNRIRMQFDVSYGGHKGQSFEGQTSETIPDLSLTVRQLLENHTRGKDSNVEVRKPLYFDLPIPVINDITDVEKYKSNLEEQLKQTNAFIKQEQEENLYDKKAAESAQEPVIPEPKPDNL